MKIDIKGSFIIQIPIGLVVPRNQDCSKLNPHTGIDHVQGDIILIQPGLVEEIGGLALGKNR
jgi:hypothetical protein